MNTRAQQKEKSAMTEMGIYQTMRTLRAVRRLRPDPIPDDVLHRVLEAATWAPTGGNSRERTGGCARAG
jgi:nitroreductase